MKKKTWRDREDDDLCVWLGVPQHKPVTGIQQAKAIETGNYLCFLLDILNLFISKVFFFFAQSSHVFQPSGSPALSLTGDALWQTTTGCRGNINIRHWVMDPSCFISYLYVKFTSEIDPLWHILLFFAILFFYFIFWKLNFQKWVTQYW